MQDPSEITAHGREATMAAQIAIWAKITEQAGLARLTATEMHFLTAIWRATVRWGRYVWTPWETLVTDLAESAGGFTRSNAHRAFKGLVTKGFIHRTPGVTLAKGQTAAEG